MRLSRDQYWQLIVTGFFVQGAAGTERATRGEQAGIWWLAGKRGERAFAASGERQSRP
jgi:hypothetical protein